MTLPPNVHVSIHPCVLAKLSRLRSQSTPAREVKTLVHDIASIIACEAFATSLTAADGPMDTTPMGFEYTTTTISPRSISLVPILRSGLGMIEAVQQLLPDSVPVHHLGLYRDPTTLTSVEYYNNLPNHLAISPSASATSPEHAAGGPSELAIVVDPVIATGGTCAAAIQTLREWGVQRIVVLSVIAAAEGLRRAAQQWGEGTQFYVAGVDAELTDKGMLKPGLGDVGDRLFLTIGK
ncbi:uracil phosphoribosyltransferase-domain-containing protein [Microdochium trichocladiopsis]|uniref:uracil phosphoribosyltransferase n=1 Tax=Microdochium trichocladiopsis TaxID=1682393 RepID=A0A9P8YKX9_9PEZI|nr:uracil phosphoribosyltransferase-domain-containing protein [Microdochium trichocladiopsis]KAH7041416.1 uracil phosphoribosyltransferase-domain-containing protein [Microdochium trichocladiopsis]